MTTEYILLLGLYAFLLLGVFLGDRGPMATFNRSTPRFAAVLERNISVGREFRNGNSGGSTINWSDPDQSGGP